LPKITLYTGYGDYQEDKIREHLETKGVEFKEVNVLNDEDEKNNMIRKSQGNMTTPVLEIDDKIILEFNEETIDKALEESE